MGQGTRFEPQRQRWTFDRRLFPLVFVSSQYCKKEAKSWGFALSPVVGKHWGHDTLPKTFIPSRITPWAYSASEDSEFQKASSTFAFAVGVSQGRLIRKCCARSKWIVVLVRSWVARAKLSRWASFDETISIVIWLLFLGFVANQHLTSPCCFQTRNRLNASQISWSQVGYRKGRRYVHFLSWSNRHPGSSSDQIIHVQNSNSQTCNSIGIWSRSLSNEHGQFHSSLPNWQAWTLQSRVVVQKNPCWWQR